MMFIHRMLLLAKGSQCILTDPPFAGSDEAPIWMIVWLPGQTTVQKGLGAVCSITKPLFHGA